MTSRWWIAVTLPAGPVGFFASDEPGFIAARRLADSVTSEAAPAVLRPAFGSIEVASYALTQNVTVVAPAKEVTPT